MLVAGSAVHITPTKHSPWPETMVPLCDLMPVYAQGRAYAQDSRSAAGDVITQAETLAESSSIQLWLPVL